MDLWNSICSSIPTLFPPGFSADLEGTSRLPHWNSFHKWQETEGPHLSSYIFFKTFLDDIVQVLLCVKVTLDAEDGKSGLIARYLNITSCLSNMWDNVFVSQLSIAPTKDQRKQLRRRCVLFSLTVFRTPSAGPIAFKFVTKQEHHDGRVWWGQSGRNKSKVLAGNALLTDTPPEACYFHLVPNPNSPSAKKPHGLIYW